MNTIFKNLKALIILTFIPLFLSNCDNNASGEDNSNGSYLASDCNLDTSYTKVLTGTIGYDIIRASSCSYVISGSTGKTSLIKIDESGNEIWNRSYSEISGSHWGKSVFQTFDGGYIIGANQNTIIKTDSVGIMMWYKKLSYSAAHYVEDIIQTYQGDYIVVGGVGGDPIGGHAVQGKAFILKMSESGDVHWVKRFGVYDAPANSFWGVVQADDGGFVLAGEKLQDRNFEFYDDFWVLKVDNEGNEVWSHEFGGNLWDEARDIVKLTDDSYIVAGKKGLSSTNLDLWVMRISSTGDVIWVRTHGNSNYETGTSLTVTSDERLVGVGGYTRTNSGSPFNYRIWTLDVGTGQIIWNRIFGGSDRDEAYGIVSTYDGGFALIGRSYSYGDPYTTWMVKTDSTGRIN